MNSRESVNVANSEILFLDQKHDVHEHQHSERASERAERERQVTWISPMLSPAPTSDFRDF